MDGFELEEEFADFLIKNDDAMSIARAAASPGDFAYRVGEAIEQPMREFISEAFGDIASAEVERAADSGDKQDLAIAKLFLSFVEKQLDDVSWEVVAEGVAGAAIEDAENDADWQQTLGSMRGPL